MPAGLRPQILAHRRAAQHREISLLAFRPWTLPVYCNRAIKINRWRRTHVCAPALRCAVDVYHLAPPLLHSRVNAVQALDTDAQAKSGRKLGAVKLLIIRRFRNEGWQMWHFAAACRSPCFGCHVSGAGLARRARVRAVSIARGRRGVDPCLLHSTWLARSWPWRMDLSPLRIRTMRGTVQPWGFVCKDCV